MLLAITQQACLFLKVIETDLIGYCKVGQIRTHKLMKGRLMNSYVFLLCARSVLGGTEQNELFHRSALDRDQSSYWKSLYSFMSVSAFLMAFLNDALVLNILS